MSASMSRKGNCYDNAPMESFWGILKNEQLHHCRYETRQEARQDITGCPDDEESSFTQII